MERFRFERLLSTRLRRRSLLVSAGALTGLALASQWPTRQVIARPNFSDYPFKLGVASGDPLPDGIVLWTRLAPQPLTGNGGMSAVNIPVQWQLATDPNMSNVVLRGTTLALPELAHSIRVVISSLQPNRWYWYQFKAGTELSPIGRTRTAPVRGTPTNQLNFAFASCQMYEHGYFTAYKYMAQEDLNLVVHLGDYIYEYGPNEYQSEAGNIRLHNSSEIKSLEDYRNRYALYKSDPDLQAAHAAFPWIVTWDDHEVENNYANLIPEDEQSQQDFAQRRANAYRAYYEHMPLRRFALPDNSNMRLYRRLAFGDLAEFHVLDTRQYRSDQPCGDNLKPRCPGALEPSQTMTGSEQEQWLFQGLDNSKARWNVIAQQTMMAQYDFDARPGTQLFNMDQWDGYVAARDRLLNFIQQQRPSNPIVITGDIHSNWVHDLKANFDNPASPTVATEFVGTSITSDFPTASIAPVTAALSDNPHTKFFDGKFRGYVRCNLTRECWQSDFRVVSTILDPNASISTLASFVVKNGQAGAERI